ncbi:MAG: hypothetical protein NTW06_04995 [Candidatus Falkowbacteria bacterium]|nr:hypothetical protein [Candidatus Falkowbacteria bacterium]
MYDIEWKNQNNEEDVMSDDFKVAARIGIDRNQLPDNIQQRSIKYCNIARIIALQEGEDFQNNVWIHGHHPILTKIFELLILNPRRHKRRRKHQEKSP